MGVSVVQIFFVYMCVCMKLIEECVSVYLVPNDGASVHVHMVCAMSL